MLAIYLTSSRAQGPCIPNSPDFKAVQKSGIPIKKDEHVGDQSINLDRPVQTWTVVGCLMPVTGSSPRLCLGYYVQPTGSTLIFVSFRDKAR